MTHNLDAQIANGVAGVSHRSRPTTHADTSLAFYGARSSLMQYFSITPRSLRIRSGLAGAFCRCRPIIQPTTSKGEYSE
jgi:hypothetical protein